VVFDSLSVGAFFENTIQFADKNWRRVPVNFVSGLVTVAPVHDLAASLQHFGGARRGSWRFVRVLCRNKGGCPASGTATLNFPAQADAVFGYGRGHPASGGASFSVPVTIDNPNRRITWDVPTLAAGEGIYLWARYKVPCNIATGTPLVTSVLLEPTAGDMNAADNSASVSKLAAAGTPPCNTFAASPGGEQSVLAAQPFGEIFGLEAIDTLTYLVAFQNVGSGTVSDVAALDSLDPNLAEATFDSAGASHSVMFGRSGSALTWNFNNINLPDSTADPIGSVGFAAFRVRADAGLPEGVEIENSAILTFDGATSFAPVPIKNRYCAAPPGDLNLDDDLSPADVIVMLNCVFVDPGGCNLCADHNCDGLLTPAEVVVELNAVFLDAPIVCP